MLMMRCPRWGLAGLLHASSMGPSRADDAHDASPRWGLAGLLMRMIRV